MIKVRNSLLLLIILTFPIISYDFVAQKEINKLFLESKFDDLIEKISPVIANPCELIFDKYEEAVLANSEKPNEVTKIASGPLGNVYSFKGFAVKIFDIKDKNKLKLVLEKINFGKHVNDKNTPYLVPVSESCLNVKNSKSGFPNYKFYVAMPLYAKGSLRSFIADDKNRILVGSYDWKMSVIYGIMNGIASLNNFERYHKSITLDDILMETDFKIKILNIGVEKSTNANKRENEPFHLKLRNSRINDSADDQKLYIGSLGILFFEILNALNKNIKPVSEDRIVNYCGTIKLSSYSLEKLEYEEYCVSYFPELIASMISESVNSRPDNDKVLRTLKKFEDHIFNRELRVLEFSKNIKYLPIGNAKSEYQIRKAGLLNIPVKIKNRQN
jgi:hypothetical protein